MMSTSQETSKEVAPCKAEPKSKGKGLSAPSSPRTPSPAASLLTISSGTMTEKSCKGGDEASFSGACEKFLSSDIFEESLYCPFAHASGGSRCCPTREKNAFFHDDEM